MSVDNPTYVLYRSNCLGRSKPFTGHRTGMELTVPKRVKEESRELQSLIKLLTEEDIRRIVILLEVPKVVIEKFKRDNSGFIFVLRDEWEDFSGTKFHEALNDIGRVELAEIVKRIPWLTKESVQKKEITVRSFVHLLRDEVVLSKWRFIVCTELGRKFEPNLTFETAFKHVIDSGAIKPNLSYLCELMELVERNDIAKKIQKYKFVFEKFNQKELNKKILELKYIQNKSHKKTI